VAEAIQVNHSLSTTSQDLIRAEIAEDRESAKCPLPTGA
jgi:hypothetical protein